MTDMSQTDNTDMESKSLGKSERKMQIKGLIQFCSTLDSPLYIFVFLTLNKNCDLYSIGTQISYNLTESAYGESKY